MKIVQDFGKHLIIFGDNTMYCVREDDNWYCIDDDVYTNEVKTTDDYTSLEFFKERGHKYFINEDGRYEKQDQHKG